MIISDSCETSIPRIRVVGYPKSWRVAEGEQKAVAAAAAIDDELAEDLGAGGPEEDDSVPPEIRLVALKSVRRQEVEISKFEGIGKIEDLPASSPDWRALLTRSPEQGGFGKPATPRENDAIEEKVRALEVLFDNRISILTGGAGTGKTSVLRVFLEEVRKTEEYTPTLLAAPTGKARVRLQAATGGEAHTIHQVLQKAGMLGPRFRILMCRRKAGHTTEML